MDVGKCATNDNVPGYFAANHKCYQHRIDALKFMYRVKIYAKN